MGKYYLEWDQVGEKFYETGVKQGVLYPYDTETQKYAPGVAWNGLTSVSETPSGAESNPIYADDIKYLDIRSNEEFGGTIEAYTFPDQWRECDGSTLLGDIPGVVVGQQSRKLFGLSYRTVIGNDVDYNDKGYKLHLVYGATASASERQYQTINDSPEAITFSWEFTTVPVKITVIDGLKPTSILTIDSRNFVGEDKAKLEALETALYGTPAEGQTPAVNPYLPLPDEVFTILGGSTEDESE